MKKTLIITLIGLLLVSCEKDSELDYRARYVGKYACSYEENISREWDQHYTIVGVDTIEVGIVDDSMLYFKSIPGDFYYYDSDNGYVMVSDSGTFILSSSWDWEYKSEGYFANDSVVINQTYQHRWYVDKQIIKGEKLKK